MVDHLSSRKMMSFAILCVVFYSFKPRPEVYDFQACLRRKVNCVCVNYATIQPMLSIMQSCANSYLFSVYWILGGGRFLGRSGTASTTRNNTSMVAQLESSTAAYTALSMI